ncbi:CST complex subunit TEN1 [Trichoplax sp. H2]|nr:CST complex subunit TEN1 [Trichoplax sp. H2]|eukprot:RDD41798.1 CST complex subunit TEN1 [Trichoplax sp. H2]
MAKPGSNIKDQLDRGYSEILRISEIVSRGKELNGRDIKTIGRVQLYDAMTSRATISCAEDDPNSQLVVITEFIEPLMSGSKATYQFIGELEWQPQDSALALKARTCRDVSKLDITRYYQGLDSMRKFLNSNAS